MHLLGSKNGILNVNFYMRNITKLTMNTIWVFVIDFNGFCFCVQYFFGTPRPHILNLVQVYFGLFVFVLKI